MDLSGPPVFFITHFRSSYAALAEDYIPCGDAEFNGWLANFVTYANANRVGRGLVAGDMAPVTTAQTTWNRGYCLRSSPQRGDGL